MLEEHKASSKSSKNNHGSRLLKIALYKDLYELNITSDILDKFDYFSEIKKIQIDDRKKENEFKTKFNRDTIFKNKISNRVKSQYEENPYPRWMNIEYAWEPKPLNKILNENYIKLSNKEIFSKDHIKALVAGCGTGSQPIMLAKRLTVCILMRLILVKQV